MKTTKLVSSCIAILCLIIASRSADARRYSKEERDAMFLRIIQPQYPPEARGRNHEGRGLFRLLINERGTVTAVTVLKSTGHQILDSEAVQTFKQWVARPGEHREVDVPLTFTLSGYKNTKPPTPPFRMDGTVLGR